MKFSRVAIFLPSVFPFFDVIFFHYGFELLKPAWGVLRVASRPAYKGVAVSTPGGLRVGDLTPLVSRR